MKRLDMGSFLLGVTGFNVRSVSGRMGDVDSCDCNTGAWGDIDSDLPIGFESLVATGGHELDVEDTEGSGGLRYFTAVTVTR